MYVLNFQKQFVPAIESGLKTQTIRAIRKDNRTPKVGDTLRLYTGMRTKFCRRIADVKCTDVLPIKISDTEVLTSDFAKSDGFGSWEDMREWFKKAHGLPFEGILIKWGKNELQNL